MLRSWKNTCLNAVANKELPILPGDYVIFQISGRRFLIVYPEPQSVSDVPHEAGENTGQWVTGLMCDRDGSSWVRLWISWRGFSLLWRIHRDKKAV